MRTMWERVNWTGLFGAVVLLGYGWLREPLAAVLGGLIFVTDLLALIVSGTKKWKN